MAAGRALAVELATELAASDAVVRLASFGVVLLASAVRLPQPAGTAVRPPAAFVDPLRIASAGQQGFVAVAESSVA